MRARMSGCFAVLLLMAASLPQNASPGPWDAVAWLPALGEVHVRSAATGQIHVFDPLLREKVSSVDSLPADAKPISGTDFVQLPVWSRRELQVDPQSGGLALGPASWEREPVLRFGPNWICLELRSGHAGGVLEWRRVGDEEIEELRFRGDRADALTQRVWLENINAGERLEIRWAHPRPRFPKPTPAWVEVTMPAVDPAGERPTEAWP